MMVQYEITIKGRVQGVGYRYFAVQKANEMGITGWVRNLVDGSGKTNGTSSNHLLLFRFI